MLGVVNTGRTARALKRSKDAFNERQLGDLFERRKPEAGMRLENWPLNEKEWDARETEWVARAARKKKAEGERWLKKAIAEGKRKEN